MLKQSYTHFGRNQLVTTRIIIVFKPCIEMASKDEDLAALRLTVLLGFSYLLEPSYDA